MERQKGDDRKMAGGTLSDFRDTGLIFQEACNKTIASVRLEKGERTEDGLIIHFDDGHALRIWDDGQSCCELRYMTTDDDLRPFVGARFLGAEVLPAPNVPDEWGEHEVAFLVVRTSLGTFTIETHNEHNGYYGGFGVAVEEIGE